MANNPTYRQRTLTEFKTKLAGGGARPNLFECEINFPSAVFANAGVDLTDDLRFMITAAQLPGSMVNSIQVPFRGRVLKISGDRTYDPWSITVINDTSFKLRNAFERWNNALNRHDDSTGIINPTSYQADIIVRQLSRGTSAGISLPADSGEITILKSYKLFGCFPTSVDPIPLSYDSNDTIENFNVTFEVQYMDALEGASATSLFNNRSASQTT